MKEILFTNAAVQNRDFSLDEKPYKSVGIITARVLNYLNGCHEVVHCWNDVGMFADMDTTTRYERTEKKYSSQFMREHLERWGAQESFELVSDADRDFAVWACATLERACTDGIVYHDSADFVACSKCGRTIASAEGVVARCARCDSSDHLYLRREEALFVDLPDDRNQLVRYDQIYNKNNIKKEYEQFKQFPSRLLLSRDRDAGIELGGLGFEGKVVDPRLGIGLLALYEADKRGFSRAGMVQSFDTLIRTAPYLGAVVPDANRLGVPDIAYALHAKIDPELLTENEVLPELLCFHALRARVNITRDKLLSIMRERDAILRKKDAVVAKVGQTQDMWQPLVSCDSNAECGNFVGILGDISKKLGQTLEIVKHGNTSTKDQNELLKNTLLRVNAIEKIL